MRWSARTVSFFLLALLLAPALVFAQTKLSARWVGQDGRDLVGTSIHAGPNDVQDIHIVLAGLPPARAITKLKITGLGGAVWGWVPSGSDPGFWRAEILRTPGSPTADVYIEPSGVEKGRPFFVELTLDDGQTRNFDFKGGKADPNRRTAAAAMSVQWVGQVARDRTGPGPAVGPDGLQDVQLRLERLSPKAEIRTITLDAPGGLAWRYGTNPEAKPNAEFLRDPKDPSRGDLFFQPDRDLAGTTLTVKVSYPEDKSDTATVKAQRTEAKRAMPAPPAVKLVPNTITVTWQGQDGTAGTGPGDVHLALAGLTRNHVITAVALSGAAGGSWFEKAGEKIAVAPSRAPAR